MTTQGLSVGGPNKHEMSDCYYYYYYYIIIFYSHICYKFGAGSVVGIASGYGLDGPGSNPGPDEIFRCGKSRPAL